MLLLSLSFCSWKYHVTTMAFVKWIWSHTEESFTAVLVQLADFRNRGDVSLEVAQVPVSPVISVHLTSISWKSTVLARLMLAFQSRIVLSLTL